MVNFSVFNELSLPLRDIKEFEYFFELLTALRNYGFEKVRMDREFTQYSEILPEVTFQQLIGQMTDRTQKRRLLNFLSNSISIIESPLILDSEDEKEQLLENEYFFNGSETKGGLACCDIWNTIAISFASDEQWKSERIELQKHTVLDEESTINIRHASLNKHLNTHENFFHELEEELRLEITQNNFWDRREEFFPNKIIFSREVEKQIGDLDKRVFNQAMGILRDVEKGRKLITDFNYSGESQSVKNNAFLKKQRFFTVKGKKIYFDNHVKSLLNANRIYFLEEEGNIYIGYIGEHLPTKQY